MTDLDAEIPDVPEYCRRKITLMHPPITDIHQFWRSLARPGCGHAIVGMTAFKCMPAAPAVLARVVGIPAAAVVRLPGRQGSSLQGGAE